MALGVQVQPAEKDTTALAAVASHEADTTAIHGITDTTQLVTSTQVDQIVKITQSAYAALGTPDPNTLYLIVGASYLAQDTFTRSVTGGLGAADIGGTYTVPVPAQWAVNGSAAVATLNAAGVDLYASLLGVSALNQDASITVSPGAVTTAGAFFAFLNPRYTSAAQTYRVRVAFNPAGVLQVTPQKVVATVATDLATAATVAGVTYAANSAVSIRAQATGSNPTTLNYKVWIGAEPSAWTGTVTDSQTELQSAASAGFYFRSGSGTPTPLPFTFTADNYTVQ
jgi:hypothetical protein